MGPYYWQVLTVLLSLVVAIRWSKKRSTMGADGKGARLPPGPRGLPILGSILLLGKNPHHNLRKLAQKYGPIMNLRLGFVPVIIVSSPKAAEQFLKTHDLIFSSRPPHEAAWHMSWEGRSLVFAPYGAYWRNMRKMCLLELLSPHKIESFKGMRTEEVRLMVESMRAAALEGTAVNVTFKVSKLTTDMSCRTIFGKKYMDEEFNKTGFKEAAEEVIQLLATPNLGDYIPYLKNLDLQRLKNRMKAAGKVFDSFLEKIIEEHISNPKIEGQTKDFVDVMLGFVGSEEDDYCMDRSSIKAIILDILGASMETSATTIDWAMSELSRNPHIMQKVQAESEKVVGLDRLVEESDLENMPYLEMVVKETLRLHPPVPLLVPHEAIHDCTVNEFHISKRSWIIINAWAINRDPGSWHDPEKFWPDRFEDRDVDVRGRNFQLIPFGSGRRGCPGLHLGWKMVEFVLAQLVHCFNWELPGGVQPSELDMTEKFGITTSRAEQLLAIPSYRLRA